MLPLGDDLLAIYLQDHLAGSTAGLELVRRARGANEGTAYGDFLARLERELSEDREALRRTMRRLDVGDDRVKVAAAWAGEKLGRLKLNGRIVGYSPLSRVVELEALALAVTGKLAGWRAIRELADHDDRVDPVELERLSARAERQLRGLREQHRSAVAEALVQD